MPKIDFVLPILSSSHTMSTLATVDDPTDGIMDVSATGVFYISQNDIQRVFQVHTDSDNISDISYESLRFFIFMNHWPENLILNPMNAMMDQPLSYEPILNVSNPNKMLVKHDFIRYLAKSLFNTPQGADLFNNESQLINSLDSLGEYSYQNDISSNLWKYATTSSHPVPEDVTVGFIVDSYSGLKATTEDLRGDENICCYLTNTLLMLHPHRFSNLTLDYYGIFKLPILAGDTISFKTTIYPTPEQHNLTGVPPFGGRSYQIKLVVDDGSHQNTII